MNPFCQSQPVCKVCGDSASGNNFGALVCESCKSFYRRHAHRRTNFTCPENGSCVLSKSNRKCCSACRLKKCFAVGMRVPLCRYTRGSDTEWSNERRDQRKLLVTRLLKRLNESTSGEQVSNCQTVTSTSSCTDYDAIQTQINAAVVEIQKQNCQQESAACARTESNADCIRLSMKGYVNAMKLFPEVLRLDDTTQWLVFREQMLSQLNIYAMFQVNADATGWHSVDSVGMACEERFSEFIRCLLLDGVDARSYVTSFTQTLTCLRSRFGQNWPTVLLTLCMINLFSSSSSTSCISVLQQQQNRYESYLKRFLLEKHLADSDTFRFCVEQFPSALRKLADLQQRMLLRPSPDCPRDTQHSGVGHLDLSLSDSLGKVLDPIVAQVISLLSFT